MRPRTQRSPMAFTRREGMAMLKRGLLLLTAALMVGAGAACAGAPTQDPPAQPLVPPAAAPPPALPPPEAPHEAEQQAAPSPETPAPAAQPGATLPEALPPATPPPPVPKAGLFHRHRLRGQAWVAAANPLAVEAGLEILGKGGSAVDAAVAVQTMLGLVEPQSSGIAGGAFLMYYDARSHEVSALDGREKAPAAASPDMFLDQHGKPLPFLEAVRSGRSTGVPGAIAMLYAAHSRLGVLRWKELFQPAIRAASQGFRVPERLATFLGYFFNDTPTNE